jgi:prepilin-type N-terminal cleavage/methylation domain-containing protein
MKILYKNKAKDKTAFTLIELSIVLIIIGLVITAVVAGRSLVDVAKISGAKSITKTSAVNGIENLDLWLETTSDESFNQPLVDGDTINRINDINPQLSSGVGDATQSSPTKRPTFKKNIQNGLPMMRFESGDFLETSITHSYVKPLTLFVVASTDDYSGDFMTFVIQNFYYLLGGSESKDFYSDINGGGGSLTVSIDQRAIYAIRHNGSTVTYYKNGVSSNSSSIAINATNDNNKWRLVVEPSGGYIGEVIMFQRAISDTELDNVEAYLSDKWGIALE